MTEIRTVDMRSDTLTLPTKGMLQAMVEAPLGDDVFGEDPSVQELQTKTANLLGKEAALFVPSGTMANLICVMLHCRERGSEFLLGDKSHIYIFEQGGSAQLAGVHPRALQTLPDGTLSLQEIEEFVRKDDPHFPRTSLICVENTHNLLGGIVLPMEWMDKLGALCSRLHLPLHVDGARLLNAAECLQVSPAALVRHANSVSLCLSKGLGAPVGSLIVSDKSFIQRAIRVRKVLGGGMRQVGILAGAGLYALQHYKDTIRSDHGHAQDIAKYVSLLNSKNVWVNMEKVNTNIILLHINTQVFSPKAFCERMQQVTRKEEENLQQLSVCKILPISSSSVRLVCHRNINHEDVLFFNEKIKFVIEEIDNRSS